MPNFDPTESNLTANDNKKANPKKTITSGLNVRWIVFGSLLMFIVIALGEILLAWVVESDPELDKAFDQLKSIETTQGKLDESAKNQYKKIIFSNLTFLLGLGSTVLLALGSTAALVGFFTRRFRDTLVALGSGTLLVSVVLLKHPPFIITIGVALVIIGLFGAKLVARLRKDKG